MPAPTPIACWARAWSRRADHRRGTAVESDRAFSTTWTGDPVSGADRAMLEWPGRPLKREDALAAVRAALVSQGAAPDCDVEIPGFTPPIVPLSGVSGSDRHATGFRPRTGPLHRHAVGDRATGCSRSPRASAARFPMSSKCPLRSRDCRPGRYPGRTMCAWHVFMWPRCMPRSRAIRRW